MIQNSIQTPETPENIFKGKISELAYNYMRASYPSLVPFIITFKVDTIDLQKGLALGVFIIRYGKDLLYIPVVINGSTILSCEMVYNKTNNTFKPLINKEVYKIIKANELIENTLVRNPRINTTYNMFRSMLRPPVSERMGYASADVSDGLSDLPNKYKEALFNKIANDKELIKNISEFYPMTELLNKLKPTTPIFKEASDKTIITIDDLDENTRKFISKEAAEDIINKGYGFLEKRKYSHFLYKKDDVNKLMVLAYKLSEVAIPDNNKHFAADVVVTDKYGNPVVMKHSIILGNTVFMSNNSYALTTLTSYSKNLVISGSPYDVCSKSLECCGAIPVKDFLANNTTIKESGTFLSIWIPTKNNKFKPCNIEENRTVLPIHKHFKFNKFIENDFEGISIIDYLESATNIILNNNLQHSSFRVGNSVHIPQDSYILISSLCDVTCIDDLKTAVKLVTNTAAGISLARDNHTYTIKDNNIVKTMTKEAELAEYLHNNYDVHPNDIVAAIDTINKNPYVNNNFLVLEKQAATFDMSSGNMQGMVQQNIAQQTGNPTLSAYKPNAGSPNLSGRGLPPVIDSNMIEIYSKGFDKSLLDIGILASLYNNEDIKHYLLDFTPQFTDTISNLGKAILLFSINKDALEASYGVGEYYNIISIMRKIFKSLAEVVNDLEIYLNNNTLGKDNIYAAKENNLNNKSLIGTKITNNI